ncbi:MAG: hypothetical protein KDD55_08795 [Bdellovibrionales bacterium]|nr:hypothetical protein [Bdellovibrionales bacterium]
MQPILLLAALLLLLTVLGCAIVVWQSGSSRYWLVPLILCALSALVIFPEEAANFPVSDGIEYAIGAARLAHEHSYSLLLHGQSYSPRYDPGFSLFLSPLYAFFGDHLGVGVYVVTFFSVCGGLAAFSIGALVGGVFGGLFAFLFVVSLGSFRYFGTQILTDVPSATLGLLLGLLYLALTKNQKDKKSPHIYLLVGFLIGVASSFRPTNIFFILPFLFLLPREKKESSLFLVFPVLISVVLSLTYHREVFGHLLRTGYHYWTSVPYDSLSLVFNINYFEANFQTALPVFQALILLLLLVFVLRCPAQEACMLPDERVLFRRISLYVFLTATPTILVYLFYFYSSPRFFLYPLMSVGILLAGRLGGRIRVSSKVEKGALFFALLVSLAAVYMRSSYTVMDSDERYQNLLSLRGDLPRDATLITSENPALVEYIVRTSPQQQIVPLSRKSEYASKCVAPESLTQSIRDNDILDPFAHRSLELLQAGCLEVYDWVAQEGLNHIQKRIKEGDRVFISSHEEWRDEMFTYTLFKGSLLELKLGKY